MISVEKLALDEASKAWQDRQSRRREILASNYVFAE